MEDNTAEQRKEKIKTWLKNKQNLSVLGILSLSLAIRIYFLNITKNQTHWWDTLAYGGIAKNIIYHAWDNSIYVINEAIIRPPVIPYLWSVFITLNLSDAISLFFLQVLPSAFSVLFVFLIVKEFYGKKVAYLSSLILSLSWIHLFYTTRMMTDIPSMFLSLASIYFFAKSYNKLDFKNFSLAIFFLSLAFLTRYVYALLGFVFLAYLLIHHRGKLFSKKNFYSGGIVGLIPLFIFFLINLFKSGELLPAFSVYEAGAEETPAFAFYALDFFKHILQTPFYWLFLLGAALVILMIFLGYGRITKMKMLQAHTFNFLLLVMGLAYFIFYLRAAEDRYLFMIFLPMVTFTSIGIIYISDYIKKYSKPLGAIFIIIILAWGGYQQLTFANQSIKSKVNTYVQMKDAFLWAKENTPEDSVFLGMGAEPYAIYYAERPVEAWPQEDFENQVEQIISNSDYLVLNALHPTPQDIMTYINDNLQSRLQTVYASFFDQAQTQPAVIIYQINEEEIVLIEGDEDILKQNI